jgi:deazaflavin-dependent oxidoreductase (nitroreductase family)
MAFVRPFTVGIVNPVLRHVAGRLPMFCIATYRGRTSGRTYRTPLNVFVRGSRVVFALTYGEDVQWVRNVIAAGGCAIRTRGRDVHLENPRVERDPAARAMPWLIRPFLRFMRVDRFLWLDIAEAPPEVVPSFRGRPSSSRATGTADPVEERR